MNGKLALLVVMTLIWTVMAFSFSGGSLNERTAAEPRGGSPTPTPSPGISGIIRYDLGTFAPFPISGVTVTCQGAQGSVTATTLANGEYWLDTSTIGPGPYTVTPSKTGGANGITSFDAGYAARLAMFPFGIPANLYGAADVSGNGGLTSFDAALIARYAAGLSDSGLTGMWRFVPVSRTYQTIDTHISGQDIQATLRGELTGNWVDRPPSP
jgi:hypothetical protein